MVKFIETFRTEMRRASRIWSTPKRASVAGQHRSAIDALKAQLAAVVGTQRAPSPISPPVRDHLTARARLIPPAPASVRGSGGIHEKFQWFCTREEASDAAHDHKFNVNLDRFIVRSFQRPRSQASPGLTGEGQWGASLN